MNDARQTSTLDTLSVPGAQLYYEVRGSGPTVLLIGNPMDAGAFTALADQLADGYTVMTTDPRGINRSPVDDADQDVTAPVRADDLSRLLTHLGVGPAAVFGSSGGAVSTLALVQEHPEQVHLAIAHEAPLQELLDDRDRQRSATDAIISTYRSGDPAGAWALFLGAAHIERADGEAGPELPPEPDPQAVADERFFFEHLLRPTTRWRPDIDALRAVSGRVVIGIGETSHGQLCDLTSRALADAMGVEPTFFPGGHVGFLEDPPAFAARLRTVLDAREFSG